MEAEKEKKEGKSLARFNRFSETTHSNIVRAQTRVRLSLKYHIALHYCGELARTFLLWALLLLTAFCIGESIRLRPLADRVAAAAPDEEGAYSQLILQDSRARAVCEPENGETDFGATVRMLFGSGFPGQAAFPVALPAGGRAVVTLNLRTEWQALLVLMIAGAAADLMRMIYFWRKAKRLNKSVMEPIRSMTEMADTLSAANLSNRINVANTKTELQELAVVINSMLDRLEQSYNSQK